MRTLFCAVLCWSFFFSAPLSVTANELVGEYSDGSGLAVRSRLILQNNGAFRFTRAGEMQEYVKKDGSYKLENGMLELSPSESISLDEPLGPAFATRLQPVTWSSRLYLIPENSMLDFCNAVNLGIESRLRPTSPFLLREGDEHKPVANLPELPAQWKPYLLHEPLRGEITGFNDAGLPLVNLGTRHGLKPGMLLFSQDNSSKRATYLKLVSVEQNQSSAEIDKREGFVAKVGIPVSSWINIQTQESQ